LVLSGRPEVRSDAMAAGAAAFVSKADSPEHLMAAILKR
jgi:DNA-binding NarL/FixJ family response regulator